MKAAVLVLLAAACAFAQQWGPNVVNGRVETLAFSGDLGAQLRASTPAWFGYAVRAVPGEHGDRCRCSLEDGWQRSAESGTIHLEEPGAISVLYRVSNDGVEKVRVFSIDCQIDAGGKAVVWLTGVPADASIAWLEKLVRADSTTDTAVMAIAQHDTALADTVLEKMVRPAEPEHLREKVIFWLGAARGARGVQLLGNMLASDASDNIRDKAVFGLFVSRQPEALPLIIRAAKSDTSGHVRGQALFWLAQKAGKRAAEAIDDAIRNDPDTEVKKRAVFALSQLPKDEGVPKLIEVARTQRNPEVRKQAFFWLGQSQDPRALAYIEQVLEK